jgi:hypothetical protein
MIFHAKKTQEKTPERGSRSGEQHFCSVKAGKILIRHTLSRKIGGMVLLALDKSAKNGEDDLFAECGAGGSVFDEPKAWRRSARKKKRKALIVTQLT